MFLHLIKLPRKVLKFKSTLVSSSSSSCHHVLFSSRNYSTSKEEGFLSIDQEILDKSISTVISEPTFQSLGIGVEASFFPHRILQTFMENIHVLLDIPWYQTIIATTIVLRVLVFPVIVKTRKSMVNLSIHQPEVNRLRDIALTETDPDKKHKATYEMLNYMKANNVMPHKTFMPMIMNGIVMTSMFFALRGMALHPVESMNTGGTYWFLDLCTADPTYLLPVLTCSSMLLQIHLGADGMKADNFDIPFMKTFMYALPIFSFPVMTQFPAALNVYWLTSNLISLVQARALELPAVKKALDIGEVVKDPAASRKLKESIEDLKKTKDEAIRCQKENVPFDPTKFIAQLKTNREKERSNKS